MTQIDNLAELMNDVESMSFLEGKVFCKKCNAPDHPDNMNALGLCMNCISVIALADPLTERHQKRTLKNHQISCRKK